MMTRRTRVSCVFALVVALVAGVSNAVSLGEGQKVYVPQFKDYGANMNVVIGKLTYRPNYIVPSMGADGGGTAFTVTRWL